MQLHENYKESNIEWIDSIPAHWNEVSIKWISQIFAGGTPSKDKDEYWYGGDIPWLNSGSVNQVYIVEPSEYITQLGFEKSSAKWITKGSLVVALAGQGKTKGTVAQLGINATCNQSMAAITIQSKVQPRYLFYWLLSNYQNIRNLGGGDLRDGLNLEMIGSIKCPVPPSSEQSKIAAYLDQKTAEINKLIEDKKKLLELYVEEKAAVIGIAVSKGINPNVTFKDSEIEWLGEIPEQWNIAPMKRLGKVTDGSHFSPKTVEIGLPYVSVKDVGDNSIDLINCKRISYEDFETLKKNGCQPLKGDIIITKDGTIGRAAIVTEDHDPFVILSSLGLITPNNKIRVNYLYYFLISNLNIDQMYSYIHGSALTRLTIEKINNLIVTIPPLEEQKLIVEHIEKECAYINTKINKTQKLISLLTEYHTALICEVVTGKMKITD